MTTDTTEREIVIAEADLPLTLTAVEQHDLERCEQTIARGLDTFLDVGAALADIRDGRLYRQSHASFADYLQVRWPQIGSRRQADRLIQAAEVAADLRPIGLSLTSESQARPLAPLGGEERRQAMQQATAAAPNGQPTAKQVAEAAAAVKPPPMAKPTPLPPALPVAPSAAPGQTASAPVATPAALPPPLTPLAPTPPAVPGQADPGLQARKLLAAKRALLAATLARIDGELTQQPPGPVIVIRQVEVDAAAALFVNSSVLGGAAAMLAFSATVEEAPAPAVDRFDHVRQVVADVEKRIARGELGSTEAQQLRNARMDLDDLADDPSLETAAYDTLSMRIGAAERQLAEAVSA